MPTSVFSRQLLPILSASGWLTKLGVSSFAQTVLDDTSASAARTTLETTSLDMMEGGTISVADDAVGNITPRIPGGVCWILGANNNAAFPQVWAGAFYFDVGSSLSISTAFNVNSTFQTYNSNVTGTTGTDGWINVGRTTDQIRLENRRGGTSEFSYVIFYGNAG